MGGKALKVKTTRMNKDKYFPLSQKIKNHLEKLPYIKYIAIIPAYTEKEDFGDMDILISFTENIFESKEENALSLSDKINHLKEYCAENFNTREFYKNGTVLSFDYRDTIKNKKGFQIDLIFTHSSLFNTALNYFSYNDLGGLIGLTAKKMGLSYGDKGLIYKYYNGTQLIKSITLTPDTYLALEVLGFDSHQFKKGFKNFSDIFDYVASSKFFNKNNYRFQTMNHTSRTKNKKRESYKKFSDYIEDNQLFSQFIFPLNKDHWLPYLFKNFPAFQKEYQLCKEIVREQQVIKSHFNGKIIQKWTGLKNKELGLLMQGIRQSFINKTEMCHFLETHTQKDFKEHVLNIYNNRHSKQKNKIFNY